MLKIQVEAEKLAELQLTPNQYCLAYLIHYKEKDQFKMFKTLYKKELHFKEDLLTLATKNYLKTSNNDFTKIVFDESTIEGIFSSEETISDWDIFVEKFRDLFPTGIKSGGFYVKGSSKDCSKKLNLFIKEYKFNEETILKATENYVKRSRTKGYSYMKLAVYFILKDKISVLASECEVVLSNENGEEIGNDNLLMDGI